MFKKMAVLAGAVALWVSTGAASAEMYKDYVPGKGVWVQTFVEVDSNHVDDYLTGLKASDVPAIEVLKKHGLVDDYKVMTTKSYAAGQPNVIIAVHFVSAEAMEPDQARDQAIEKDIYAAVPKSQDDAAIAAYEKYRKFTQISNWRTVEFTK